MKVLYLAIAYRNAIDVQHAVSDALFSHTDNGHSVMADEYEVDFQHGDTENGDKPYLTFDMWTVD